MPHLPGKDLRSWPQVERTATVLHAFVWALIRRPREQAANDGLPDPPTQADAEVASTTISSTDVVEARRMDCETFRQLKGYPNSKLRVRIP
jgi:hypothetical protein